MQIVTLALAVASSSAIAQDFSYELRDVTNSPSNVLQAGAIGYEVAAVFENPQGSNLKVMRRETRLPGGWAVGCTDYGEKSPQGFGCWLARRPPAISLNKYEGFSWEWYDRGVGTLYEKRSSEGKVTLRTAETPSGYAMQSLEFLEDTTFKVNMNPKSQPGVYTHELRILKGSVLFLSPAARR
jgi:hypothetical protein